MQKVEYSAYKRIPLEILIDFANFCEINSLRYSLAYGTLLGGVRHKGYIPWDDDIDVFMLREDYERFRTNYKSEVYELKDLLNDSHYPVGVAKLCDTRTYYYYQKTAKRDFGLFIDIFVLDKVPLDENTRKDWLGQIKPLLIQNRMMNTTFSYYWQRSGIKGKVKLILLKALYPFSSYLHSKIETLYHLYQNSESNLVCSPSDIRKDIKTFCYPSQYFEKYTELEFENYKFKATAYYDEVLKTIYGNYMELPPEEERVPKHDMVAYYR